MHSITGGSGWMVNYKNRRKSARVYDLKPTTITLKNHPLKVNDISNEGIGLILEDGGPQFVTGERLETIPIPLKDGEVNVKGVVSHISITAKSSVCGIRFLFSGPDFESIIQFKKERMLPSRE